MPRPVSRSSAGGIPPLIALLASPSVRVQRYSASALQGLSLHAETCVAIASAGGIPPLIALPASPSVATQKKTAGALRSLSTHAEKKCVTIASLGGIVPLVTLLASQSAGVQVHAAGTLVNLRMHAKNSVTISSAAGRWHSASHPGPAACVNVGRRAGGSCGRTAQLERECREHCRDRVGRPAAFRVSRLPHRPCA
jgi:hypothetical protein